MERMKERKRKSRRDKVKNMIFITLSRHAFVKCIMSVLFKCNEIKFSFFCKKDNGIKEL